MDLPLFLTKHAHRIMGKVIGTQACLLNLKEGLDTHRAKHVTKQTPSVPEK